MKAVGIIAEYNPLHNGHIYHIEESKKLAGKDAVVVAMSGNFVQHGEPAILDKWERTRLAIENGADVVIEIPAVFCAGNSMQYANAGVKILESLGIVEDIAFGSESGNVEELSTIANNLKMYSDELNVEIANIVRTKGCSFPAARELAYRKVVGSDCTINGLAGSNDNLALSYLMANERLNPIAIKRVGAGYNDSAAENAIYQSATGIRSMLLEGNDVSEYMPTNVANALCQGKLTFSNKWLDTLKFSVMSMSPKDIDDCPSGGEGLGNKLKAEISQATSWDGLIKSVKSKRYTYSRISRLCIQIILGIRRNSMNNSNPGYIRVLGLSAKGRELLSYAEKNEMCTLPIITNVGRSVVKLDEDSKNQLEMDIHASDVYNLVTGRNVHECSDYRMRPIIQE